ncbi:hypothetical protein [Candidatus Liberibacter sp.]|nr:hypothetical protein [Candidatus Liberibacter sp.]MBA5723689.1 hypothetical protein [Candidatus Liberibacter sp.]
MRPADTKEKCRILGKTANRVRIPEKYGTKEFIEAYSRALAECVIPK